MATFTQCHVIVIELYCVDKKPRSIDKTEGSVATSLLTHF